MLDEKKIKKLQVKRLMTRNFAVTFCQRSVTNSAGDFYVSLKSCSYAQDSFPSCNNLHLEINIVI